MAITNVTTLGGTASDVKVAKVAHGLMFMTWTPMTVPDEMCFEAIKSGVDLCPPGVKMLVNSGEFYAHDLGTGNVEMLARFFDKNPEYADRIFLSVKGGIITGPNVFKVDSSTESLVRSITRINAALRGTKRLDLFQCARVDPHRPIEDTIGDLKSLVKQGLFDHIGMSECREETLRRANAVHPISIVEIEVSPSSMEEETRKVLTAAEELNIAVAAYSPLGRGLLTGSIKKLEDVPEGDMRRGYTRFANAECFTHNFAMTDKLNKIASEKGITAAQLCIAWVASLGRCVIPLPGSSRAARTIENSVAGDIELTEDEKREIWELVDSVEVKGDRYWGDEPRNMHLWG